jgi:hypothetical protein
VSVHLPGPTIWPAALALGVTLVAAGLVTHWIVALGGAVLVLAALYGWVALLTEQAS